MPAYLVRTIGFHDLVGVFYAPNTYALAFLIDEILDPSDCEFLIIGTGGIVWSGKAIAIPVPAEEIDLDDPSVDDPFPWSGARFSESWWMFVYYESRKRWKKVEHTLEDLYGMDPEEPDPEPEPPPIKRPGKVLAFRKPKPPKDET